MLMSYWRPLFDDGRLIVNEGNYAIVDRSKGVTSESSKFGIRILGYVIQQQTKKDF